MFWNSDDQFSIIPKELLEKSDKILFICYLAIGDFAYLQTCFKKLHEQYPNLKIDLWADEYRGRNRLLRWKNKKHDILYDWVESTPYFNKFYRNIGAWWNLNKFLNNLKQAKYPIVVSLFCSNRQNNVIKYAREISPNGFIVGLSDQISEKFVTPITSKHYLNKFDQFYLNTKRYNPTLSIMNYCANSFETLFGFKIKEAERKSFISIPQNWVESAKELIKSYKIRQESNIIFINIFAKINKRCWSEEKAIELIKILSKEQNFENNVYIINSLPMHREKLETLFKKHFNNNVFLFTANKSFFQLPAILSLCNLVISVDTSVVHLSNALNIPLVDLVRQKNVDWIPQNKNCIPVYTKKKGDWVKNIEASDVAVAAKSLLVK